MISKTSVQFVSMDEEETFVNPQPPSRKSLNESRQPLTNEDFRKLLDTPRPVQATARPKRRKRNVDPKSSNHHPLSRSVPEDGLSGVLLQLSKKYRDRAKERRENARTVTCNEEVSSTLLMGYGDVKVDEASRRRKLIEESKFLGGDISHTHLVKGLDYALLKKIRSEMNDEKQNEQDVADQVEKRKGPKSAMAEAILRAALGETGETTFVASQIAYTVEVERMDRIASFEIPTTLIRSRAVETTITDEACEDSADDVVISKVIDIWKVIREGGGKRNPFPVGPKPKKVLRPEANLPIYDEQDKCDKSFGSLYSREVGKSTSGSYYFENKSEAKVPIFDQSKKVNEAVISIAKKKKTTIDSYAECYPGTAAEQDVNIDSDEETHVPRRLGEEGTTSTDSRKDQTKRTQTASKRKLDREWQQISKIIEHRKKEPSRGAQ